ncbi:hypothetical protein U1Q18_004140 [Sarracenia purpurea var. burkii]
MTLKTTRSFTSLNFVGVSASKSQIATQPFPLTATISIEKTSEAATAISETGKEAISEDFVEGTEEEKEIDADVDIGDTVTACGNGGGEKLSPTPAIEKVFFVPLSIPDCSCAVAIAPTGRTDSAFKKYQTDVII